MVDEFIQLISEDVSEMVYREFYTYLESSGSEWWDIEMGIFDYIDVFWTDRLTEHYKNSCKYFNY
jgi:hypothetical protein